MRHMLCYCLATYCLWYCLVHRDLPPFLRKTLFYKAKYTFYRKQHIMCSQINYDWDVMASSFDLKMDWSACFFLLVFFCCFFLVFRDYFTYYFFLVKLKCLALNMTISLWKPSACSALHNPFNPILTF